MGSPPTAGGGRHVAWAIAQRRGGGEGRCGGAPRHLQRRRGRPAAGVAMTLLRIASQMDHIMVRHAPGGCHLWREPSVEWPHSRAKRNYLLHRPCSVREGAALRVFCDATCGAACVKRCGASRVMLAVHLAEPLAQTLCSSFPPRRRLCRVAGSGSTQNIARCVSFSGPFPTRLLWSASDFRHPSAGVRCPFICHGGQNPWIPSNSKRSRLVSTKSSTVPPEYVLPCWGDFGRCRAQVECGMVPEQASNGKWNVALFRSID